MSFAVVRFLATDEVAVVPCSWLFEDMCYWPPKDVAAKILPHIEKSVLPVQIWGLYKIYTLGLFATYSEARKKLLIAAETSDLASTDPEEMGKGKRRKKRKHNSSFSSLSEDDDTGDFVIPEPPSLNCPNMQKENWPIIEKISIQREADIQDTVLDDSLTLSTMKETHYNMRDSEPLNRSAGPSSPSLLTVNNTFRLNSSRTSASSNNMLADVASSPPASSHNAFEDKIEGYLKAILRNQRLLNARQKIMEENLEIITKTVNKISAGSSSSVGQDDLLLDVLLLLPISSQCDMQRLEQKFCDSAVANQMVCYLQRVGGRTGEQAVKLCLKKTISNSLAQNYSYLGQRGKVPFKNLTLCKLIIDAVKKDNPTSHQLTDDAIDKIISNWLRHAKARHESSKKLAVKFQ